MGQELWFKSRSDLNEGVVICKCVVDMGKEDEGGLWLTMHVFNMVSHLPQYQLSVNLHRFVMYVHR